MKTAQLSPPSIQFYDGRVHLALRDSHSKRQMRIEHPLQLYDDRECNLTYMITESGEFRAWQYAEVPPKVAHETGWHRSPALATFLRDATLSAVLLSFASRLSLLPQLTGGLGDVSGTELAALLKRLETAQRARDAAELAYEHALIAEGVAGIVFVLTAWGSKDRRWRIQNRSCIRHILPNRHG